MVESWGAAADPKRTCPLFANCGSISTSRQPADKGLVGRKYHETIRSMRIEYSIIFVSDMARSVAFYKDVIGMPLKFESPGWTEFNTDGATWALHICESGAENTNGIQTEIPGRCRPGFQVPNLELFHSRMLENDVPCVQEPTETFGARIAQYVDPDGLVFSVGEARSDG